MAVKTRTLRVSQNTLHRELQGETVLLGLSAGEYYGLDEIGTRVWQLIVEKGDVAGVEAAMLEEFDVDRAVLSEDINRLVDDLIAKHLIEVDESEKGADA
ncbi:MAG: PqqD family protein [Vicinamibacterales bacterium]